MGLSAATVKPPYLIYAWAILCRGSVAVVLMLDFPFSGGITVNLGPLRRCRLPLARQASLTPSAATIPENLDLHS